MEDFVKVAATPPPLNDSTRLPFWRSQLKNVQIKTGHICGQVVQLCVASFIK